MQRTVLFSGVFLGAAVLTSAWQDPAAERFVSEDIWQSVDTFFQEADDPLAAIDFEAVMKKMSIARDADGKLSLMTGIVVSLAEFDACLSALARAIAASNRITAGDSRGGMAAAAEIEIVAVGSNSFHILLCEPIGTVNGRTDENEGLRLAA